jgi:hypothetical protein
MINEALAERCLELLNEALKIDPKAISEIVTHRVECNAALSKHPTIQAGSDNADGSGKKTVSMLGFLNGLCGTFDDGPRKGWGPISALVDEAEAGILVSSFERTINK